MISHLRNKSEVCSSKQTKVDGQVFNTSLEKMWISCSFKKVFQTEIISNQNEYQIGNNGNNGNTSSDIETTKPVLRKLWWAILWSADEVAEVQYRRSGWEYGTMDGVLQNIFAGI